jgi:hypothetical protein
VPRPRAATFLPESHTLARTSQSASTHCSNPCQTRPMLERGQALHDQERAFVYDPNEHRFMWGATHREIYQREGVDLESAERLVHGAVNMAGDVQFFNMVDHLKIEGLSQLARREFKKRSRQKGSFNAAQKLLLASSLIGVATAATFIGAWQLSRHHFLSDLMFALGNAGVAAVLSVILIERLLEWRRETVWAAVREQTLNALRRTIERLFLEIYRGAPAAMQEQHPDLPRILSGLPRPSTLQTMNELAESMRNDPFAWEDHAPLSRNVLEAIEPHIERLSAVLLLRAVDAQAKPELIALVGSVERDFYHWESYVVGAEEVLHGQSDLLATKTKGLWCHALPRFIDVTLDAYRAIANEMLIDRKDRTAKPGGPPNGLPVTFPPTHECSVRSNQMFPFFVLNDLTRE